MWPLDWGDTCARSILFWCACLPLSIGLTEQTMPSYLFFFYSSFFNSFLASRCVCTFDLFCILWCRLSSSLLYFLLLSLFRFLLFSAFRDSWL
ncbi:hypothetical protein BC828DRAFT_384728 [Blastocladiella britannica]|nr:hypothetical protein BC828DRAFT_384728 [Blastocladiella britannica]